MTLQRLTVVITVLNLMLLVAQLAQRHTVSAQDVPALVRARGLEIVDAQGRVRAEIKVMPAEPTLKMPDGTVGYPEAVLLRLRDSGGGPNVKLSATDDGAGLVLGGDAGYVQALSRKANPSLKIVNKDGREQTIAATRP